MVFNENTNYDFILLGKQGRPHPAGIFNWTNNWTCFWKIRGRIAQLFSPWLRDQLARLVSITQNSGSQISWAVAPSKTLNTCGPLLID